MYESQHAKQGLFKLGHFNPSTNPFWMEDNINHLCLNHGRPPPSRTRPLVQITVQSSSDLGQVPVPLKEALEVYKALR